MGNVVRNNPAVYECMNCGHSRYFPYGTGCPLCGCKEFIVKDGSA